MVKLSTIQKHNNPHAILRSDSLIDANVYSPSAYPAGWQEQA